MMTPLPADESEAVAVSSAITWVDGDKGELRYRGYPIGDLVDDLTFEDVIFLLWRGELPDDAQRQQLMQDLKERREAAWETIRLLPDIPPSAHPLDLLRYLVSWDALRNPLVGDNSQRANYAKAIAFTAWFPVWVAAYHRRRQSLEPVAPSVDDFTVTNFLHMLHGETPTPAAVRTAQTSFILHADHELNASTFAARVTIATQSNLHAAIASALGTLAGPRHGGASDRVIHMLQEIGTRENVTAYVDGELSAKRRIMGFGHRVYRTTDPRSVHLRRMAEQLLLEQGIEEWIAILDGLRDEMAERKKLYPNVDLYAAVVNSALGIDPAFYTAVFACARVPGWAAHAMEQLDERMIRPQAEYTGPALRRRPVAV